MLNENNVRLVEEYVGSLQEVEKLDGDDGIFRNFLRIRIEVDTNNSLLINCGWTNEVGMDKWVKIKYELIVDSCYGCGMLGHAVNWCEKDVIMFPDMQEKPLNGHGCSGHRPRSQEMTSMVID